MVFKESKILKIGLVGCGRISSQHLAAVAALKDQIKLGAVCDFDTVKARETGQKYNVPFYTDYRDLLKENIDLVTICAPNGLHYPMGLAVAKTGKHALIEKPLSINLKEADHLIETFKEKGKELMVVMQLRYNQALVAAKKAIQEGKLGKIYNATLILRWSRPQSYFDEADWRGKRSLDGGTLLNQGIHYVDAFQWLLGDVESVYGKIDRVAHNIEIEDEAFSLLKFKNGAYGLIEFTIATYPKNLECSITVLGKNGTVKIGGKAVNEIELWEVANCPKPEIKETTPPGFSGSSPNHLFVYQDIINYFKGGERPFFEGRESRKSLEIIEAIYKSSAKNKEIKLLT